MLLTLLFVQLWDVRVGQDAFVKPYMPCGEISPCLVPLKTAR